MDIQFANVETPTNYQEKCLCVLVLDISGSMRGNRLDALNEGLQTFYQDIKQNYTLMDALEIAIITFDGDVNRVLEPALVDHIEMPVLVSTGGTTNLVGGIKEAIKMVEERKQFYRDNGISYKRPWIIPMTDGSPTNSWREINRISKAVNQGMKDNSFHFFAIGVKVNQSALSTLNKISSPTVPAAQLDGIRFSDFFQWLSNSMDKVSHSREGDKVELEVPTWMLGFSG
ncbi:MAG: VWA domain-containing protein [Psychrobacter sp.]|nr:VWA domain-containing protein [Psychrobacter sp.]